MLFNSYTFLLLFLPAVLAGCFWLAHRRGPHAAALWLVFASFFFKEPPACGGKRRGRGRPDDGV